MNIYIYIEEYILKVFLLLSLKSDFHWLFCFHLIYWDIFTTLLYFDYKIQHGFLSHGLESTLSWMPAEEHDENSGFKSIELFSLTMVA